MSDQRKKNAKGDKSFGVYTVEITDLNNLGCGVGRLPKEAKDMEGLVVFVRGTVTGDTVKAEIIKKTSSFTVGRLVEVVKASPMREPDTFCTAPEACGGCVYRHLKYEDELVSKHNRVAQAFKMAGLPDVTVRPVLSTGKTQGYRNKGMYPVRQGKNGAEAGFFAAKSHKLIPARSCALQPDVFGEIVACICQFFNQNRIPAYDEITGKGVLRHIYLRTATDGALYVCLVINARELPGGKRTKEDLVCTLIGKFPRITGILLNINTENTNVVLGAKYVTLWGQSYLEDTLCGKRFRISGGSFYQVNHDAAELLYNTAAEMADFKGNEVLWDLYCGVGTIGLSMADRVNRLVGIEIVPEAVVCATENAKRNAELGLIPEGVAQFFCADATEAPRIFAPADKGEVPSPDIVIIDPPRKGTTPELIKEISKRDIKRVVYISCDPETLARDCKVFRDEGYVIGDVQPVDLFPRTGHVETVVLLSKGNIDSKKIRVEFSLEDMDMSEFQNDATYPQIKEHVLEHTGLKVSSLYIAQVKQKCGIIERENYNKPKSENPKQPKCPPEKEKAIMEALKYFGMI